MEITYTPDNEPYLGRPLLFHFDEMLTSSYDANREALRRLRKYEHNDMTAAAGVLVPQSLSLAMSVRELIRQAHLFGAHVLLRPFTERWTTLLYLQWIEGGIEIWKAGWKYNERPSLSKMASELNSIIKSKHYSKDVFSSMNSMTHGDPNSAFYNTSVTKDGIVYHSETRILDRPDLCDEICHHMISGLVIVVSILGSMGRD